MQIVICSLLTQLDDDYISKQLSDLNSYLDDQDIVDIFNNLDNIIDQNHLQEYIKTISHRVDTYLVSLRKNKAILEQNLPYENICIRNYLNNLTLSSNSSYNGVGINLDAFQQNLDAFKCEGTVDYNDFLRTIKLFYNNLYLDISTDFKPIYSDIVLQSGQNTIVYPKSINAVSNFTVQKPSNPVIILIMDQCLHGFDTRWSEYDLQKFNHIYQEKQQQYQEQEISQEEVMQSSVNQVISHFLIQDELSFDSQILIFTNETYSLPNQRCNSYQCMQRIFQRIKQRQDINIQAETCQHIDNNLITKYLENYIQFIELRRKQGIYTNNKYRNAYKYKKTTFILIDSEFNRDIVNIKQLMSGNKNFLDPNYWSNYNIDFKFINLDTLNLAQYTSFAALTFIDYYLVDITQSINQQLTKILISIQPKEMEFYIQPIQRDSFGNSVLPVCTGLSGNQNQICLPIVFSKSYLKYDLEVDLININNFTIMYSSDKSLVGRQISVNIHQQFHEQVIVASFLHDNFMHKTGDQLYLLSKIQNCQDFAFFLHVVRSKTSYFYNKTDQSEIYENNLLLTRVNKNLRNIQQYLSGFIPSYQIIIGKFFQLEFSIFISPQIRINRVIKKVIQFQSTLQNNQSTGIFISKCDYGGFEEEQCVYYIKNQYTKDGSRICSSFLVMKIQVFKNFLKILDDNMIVGNEDKLLFQPISDINITQNDILSMLFQHQIVNCIVQENHQKIVLTSLSKTNTSTPYIKVLNIPNSTSSFYYFSQFNVSLQKFCQQEIEPFPNYLSLFAKVQDGTLQPKSHKSQYVNASLGIIDKIIIYTGIVLCVFIVLIGLIFR